LEFSLNALAMVLWVSTKGAIIHTIAKTIKLTPTNGKISISKAKATRITTSVSLQNNTTGKIAK
jgi:hypothetical protein